MLVITQHRRSLPTRRQLLALQHRCHQELSVLMESLTYIIHVSATDVIVVEREILGTFSGGEYHTSMDLRL